MWACPSVFAQPKLPAPGSSRKALLVGLGLLLGMAAPSPAWASGPGSDYAAVYSSELTTLNYLTSGSANEHALFANLVDNLVEYDRCGVIRPALALSWHASKDGLTWTFKLRPGVQWLTHDGKPYGEVTAQDWVDAARYVLTATHGSQTANVLYSVVKNGEKYFKGELTDFAQVGVKAKDRYTLEYTLERNVPYFLSMLTYVCFLPVNGRFLGEAGARFGADPAGLLYNGAYLLSEFDPNDARLLVKNGSYWDAGKVQIQRLRFKYNREAELLEPQLFLQGEISEADIPSAILGSWMKDPGKRSLVHPAPTLAYSFFYAFNFNPKFGPEYEPDNWRLAVNNKPFREAIFHALDRKAAMLTSEPYNPERCLQTTITPRHFAAGEGRDYTLLDPLGPLTRSDPFNPSLALRFKQQSMRELAGKARFPVKILMPYSTGMPDWGDRVQVVKQQLEALLGKDFVEVIPVGFPPAGFLGATRRAGQFALQECNWGPDYADPQTFTDPFVKGSNYNRPEFALGYLDPDGEPHYDHLVAAARAEVKRLGLRMQLFAKAEAFLIREALVIPYACGGGGFQASRLKPFAAPFAPFGISSYKFKGQVLLDRPVTPEQYEGMRLQWEQERTAAMRQAAP